MPRPVGLRSEFDEELLSHFSILRAAAIADYSDLEQTYCECLAFFGSMSAQAAAILLFQINKRPFEGLVMGRIKNERIDNIHENYWRGAIDLGRALEQRHNQIVHWSVAEALCDNSEGKSHCEFFLAPPRFWAWRQGDAEDKNKLFGPDLEIFGERCKFLSRSLSAFFQFHAGEMPPSERDAWRDIFMQPLTFPPRPDHPLASM
jgi:hypothetical protein